MLSRSLKRFPQCTSTIQETLTLPTFSKTVFEDALEHTHDRTGNRKLLVRNKGAVDFLCIPAGQVEQWRR